MVDIKGSGARSGFPLAEEWQTPDGMSAGTGHESIFRFGRTSKREPWPVAVVRHICLLSLGTEAN